MLKHKRLIRKLLLMLGAFLVLTVPVAVAAQVTQGVTQSYTSDQPLQRGMIVRLKDKDGTKVEALTQSKERDMLGVVIIPGDAPVALTTSDAPSTQNFVATTGRFPVLVSTQNGVIEPGDFITISALNGVGMKMDNNHQIVIGKALDGFDGKTKSDGTAQLDRGLIGKQDVSLGRVVVDVSIAHNPFYNDPATEGVPYFILKGVRLITDKPVSAVRIYASLIVVAVSTIIAGVIIYAGVRSSLTAVGRNPLARKTVLRGLIQVVIISFIIFTIGLVAVYLLLRL